ncbi:dioxygenase [Amycolatopsis cihanbeyliensis]|uniref:Protocatechuate 3,4-dioxygenase beta subunit n=1 Tax=Amycolatopsis cihanbeyliensis TaxID=1128664 RepID=A0A542CUA4_AMYCI|nr:dioxygenase [Amycolatopsis cihanbeyliensis]TQI94370.1 protocatechuate 3,4-dioxygenase beta subunit [Amycolatopsis cihanbeyliensis]
MTDQDLPPQPEEQDGTKPFGRKQFLQMAAATASLPVLAATTGAAAGTSNEAAGAAPAEQPRPKSLEPTPACDDGDDPTPPQTEGPYFRRNSPERASLLEPGMNGTVLTVSGQVFAARSCRPIANALLDFWQCDTRGVYDNWGYRLRGHQFTNANGEFQLTTIWPGLYTGRTRHIHVKVQAPYQRVLTSQLYFPGEPGNWRDPIFDPRLVMDVSNGPGGTRVAAFDFVLNVPY